MPEISKPPVSAIAAVIVGLFSLYAGASTTDEEINRIKVMWDQRVPMRDGVELSADIFLPRGEGRYPALLMRNPYTKSTRRAGIPYDFISYFAERGYAMVGQDVRGRGDSDGEFGDRSSGAIAGLRGYGRYLAAGRRPGKRPDFRPETYGLHQQGRAWF